MLSYMARRLLGLVVVLLGVLVVTYILVSLIPGDVAVYYAGPHASPQVLAETRHALGLDQPRIVQFVKYVGRTLQGDFGRSATLNDEPVLNAILDRLPASATLAVAIIVIEMVIALIFGTLAAMRERGPVDRAVTFLAALGVSLPAFWVGILLLYFVAYKLGWLPIGGYGDPRWQYLILPAATQGVPWGFWYARILKVSLGQTLHHDYVRTARSKGVARWRIVVRHALPNAILPVMTIAAMDLGQLLGGIVVIETVFSWPGIGQLAYPGAAKPGCAPGDRHRPVHRPLHHYPQYHRRFPARDHRSTHPPFLSTKGGAGRKPESSRILLFNRAHHCKLPGGTRFEILHTSDPYLWRCPYCTPRHIPGASTTGYRAIAADTGTLSVAYTSNFPTLDPTQAYTDDWWLINGTIFNGLYQFDRNGKPQLNLAAAPPVVSKDLKTWTFKIRPARFSNGMPVTAEDFKFSITRTLDPHLKPAASWGQTTDAVFAGAQDFIAGKAKSVSGIQVIDAHTIRFVLAQPVAVLPYLLASTYNFVTPEAVYAKETPDQIATHPSRRRALHAAIVAAGQ